MLGHSAGTGCGSVSGQTSHLVANANGGASGWTGCVVGSCHGDVVGPGYGSFVSYPLADVGCYWTGGVFPDVASGCLWSLLRPSLSGGQRQWRSEVAWRQRREVRLAVRLQVWR